VLVLVLVLGSVESVMVAGATTFQGPGCVEISWGGVGPPAGAHNE
jgi:hypothetical protein